LGDLIFAQFDAAETTGYAVFEPRFKSSAKNGRRDDMLEKRIAVRE
jgi:hypothetical protein